MFPFPEMWEIFPEWIFLLFEIGLKNSKFHFQKYKKSFILRKHKKIFQRDFLGKKIRNFFRENFWGLRPESSISWNIRYFFRVPLFWNIRSFFGGFPFPENLGLFWENIGKFFRTGFLGKNIKKFFQGKTFRAEAEK